MCPSSLEKWENEGLIHPYFKGLFSETVSTISSNFVIHEHARPGITGAPASGPLRAVAHVAQAPRRATA
jgi:hypothetical protein